MSARAAFRIGLPLLAVALVLAAATQSPRAFRHMESFRVGQVEVHGTRYLAPAEVLNAAGIGPASSVWDDEDAWVAALRSHPMIRDARVERKLPSTLRVTVLETEPVALARTPTLRAVDSAGRVLPVEPEAAGLDLPVLADLTGIELDGTLSNPRRRAAVEA